MAAAGSDEAANVRAMVKTSEVPKAKRMMLPPLRPSGRAMLGIAQTLFVADGAELHSPHSSINPEGAAQLYREKCRKWRTPPPPPLFIQHIARVGVIGGICGHGGFV